MKAERQFQGEIAVRAVVRGHELPAPSFSAFAGAGRSSAVGFPGAHRFYTRLGKRLFDIAFSAAFLLIAGFWLLPLLALVIRIDSRGPALFRQRRVGQGGVVFTCLKFRTMTHSPEAEFCQVRRNDPRVTRVGSILRRTNLDELPQFLNVLIGQMSIVGPRPHVPELDEAFSGSVPSYACRNLVKPGITGLAQISGCRGETRSVREMNHRVRFDVFYIRSVSLGMDVGIVIKTALSVLRGDDRAF
ncbi:MAG: sugar transferase [Stagnimonas sp.]|nr:sugar transferase [Stagnimonas sp.]